MNQIVHVLMYGRALCGFSFDLPYRWPKGHSWVRVADVKDITCSQCLYQATEFNKTEDKKSEQPNEQSRSAGL